jgi:hypothetical protein
MQDAGCELLRILLPRTSVNKGKKEGRGYYTSTLLDFSSTLSVLVALAGPDHSGETRGRSRAL